MVLPPAFCLQSSTPYLVGLHRGGVASIMHKNCRPAPYRQKDEARRPIQTVIQMWCSDPLQDEFPATLNGC